MATIKLDNVRKSFGKTQVIHGVDIDIADGELIVIVGPSGCGKSTLLRMVAGLETVTSGEIRIGTRRVNEVEPMDRDIAMVFQNYALYPHMTVFDNMSYGLRIARTPKAEIAERVARAAEILQLEPYLQRKPRQLSGGQRQRVAMGRAIVRDPAAFLFDEPLSNLDAKLRVQMRIEIKRLQRRFGTTSLYVTHDQLEAMTLADRLVVMNAGVVEQIGAPMHLYEQPATTFVASFIGSPAMNLIAMSADGSGHMAARDAREFTVRHGPDSRDATLGIRPEDMLALPRESLGPDDVAVPITVEAIEPVGHESFIHGRIGNSASEITVRAGRNLTFRPGDAIMARIDAAAMHWFDTLSGKRMGGT